jgi:hypothetical protein
LCFYKGKNNVGQEKEEMKKKTKGDFEQVPKTKGDFEQVPL